MFGRFHADRKKGFYSLDAARRDEFTNDIEAHKWRERISTEMMLAERFARDDATPREQRYPRWHHNALTTVG